MKTSMSLKYVPSSEPLAGTSGGGVMCRVATPEGDCGGPHVTPPSDCAGPYVNLSMSDYVWLCLNMIECV